MRNLFLVTLFVVALSQAAEHAAAAQVWNYQFTPTGSRPVFSSGEDQTPDNIGQRADLDGTFSIVIDWETNTGKLGGIDDYFVNTATVVAAPQGTVPTTTVVPDNPSNNSHWRFARGFPFNELGTVTYSNGLGHLVSNSTWHLAPVYEVWFTPTAATFNLQLKGINIQCLVGGAFAAFTGSAIAGDFNRDGLVDSGDYIQWRNSGGSPADYSNWRFSFGSGVLVPGSTVPEPPVITLLLFVTLAAQHFAARTQSRAA